MSSPEPSILNVQSTTHNQPFCAGVVIVQHGRLAVTLNTDGLPAGLKNSAWRVGGVGGGQEPGETIVECALREAREELRVDVGLAPSPVTYFHDRDTERLYQIACSDAISPLLVERQRATDPNKPYRPGLPRGPYLYYALYVAAPVHAAMAPGDDVAGILLMPFDQWHYLEQQPSLDFIIEQGGTIIESTPLDRSRGLWLPPDESVTVVARLLQTKMGLLA